VCVCVCVFVERGCKGNMNECLQAYVYGNCSRLDFIHFFDERNVYQNSSSIATKAKPSPPGSKQIILNSRAHIDACYAMVMLQHVQN